MTATDDTLREPRRPDADAEWWREAVVYENHLPSLRDGNGDGIGDLHGLIESLDYLRGTLGVDAIWVGPCYRSPLLDQGFDISDFTDIEPTFGDLATFDRLIAEAHARGLKILVDYIPNHSSDQHPWFVASRSSREDSKRDWYVWADPAPDGGPPNNWTAEIGGSVWELDAATGQYYLHTHLREQPDLNWRNPEVRAAMLDVLRFWLGRGADGVRIDVAHILMKDPELRDNPPSPPGQTNPFELQHPEFFGQLHVNDRRHPDVHDVLAEIRGVLDEFGAVAIGEIEAMEWDAWAEYYGRDLGGLHLPFAFRLIETPWEAPALRAVVRSLEAALPPGAWPVLALSNHDRSRLATRVGSAQARVAAMLLLTLRGTPVSLYGDELGLCDQPVPRERQRDHFGLTEGGVSHDPARTPMPWSAARNGGFSPADERDLWLPVSAEYASINVEAQLADPASMLNLYRSLLALRAGSAALRAGEYAEHPAGDDHCLVYERRSGGERKLVALNLTDAPRRVALPGADGAIVLSTAGDRRDEPVAGAVELRPAEGVVVDLAGAPS
ncbi:Oligo-1,6-glucosidase [Baekduia alba]|uniref:alpha-amylase family glycosyl hydrolase n=1 Tax=Baekduia alba TaxID=2997333 RepID=UPI0023416662|nr:alpha-amylase family glycosyl hydrolase [Baekduia alba]WCB93460.1 Oligo-1,6-glucosidase [Baekduia alba]